MITTIQINSDVKNALNKMKDSSKESYEEIIVKMIHFVEEQKRKQNELLIEGYKEMAEDSLKICKEWEATDAELDWEWEDD